METKTPKGEVLRSEFCVRVSDLMPDFVRSPEYERLVLDGRDDLPTIVMNGVRRFLVADTTTEDERGEVLRVLEEFVSRPTSEMRVLVVEDFFEPIDPETKEAATLRILFAGRPSLMAMYKHISVDGN